MPWPDAEELMEHWLEHPPEHVSLDRLCHAFLKQPDNSEYNPERFESSGEPMSDEQRKRQVEVLAAAIGAPTRDVSTLPPDLRTGLRAALEKANANRGSNV